MNLFAYGTLTDPRAMARVTGRPWARPIPATLRGHRLAPIALPWPTAVPHPGGIVRGVLWQGLTPTDLARLDEYEGVDEEPPLYFRREVMVETPQGPRRAWAYIFNPQRV